MSTIEYIPLRSVGGSIYFRIPASYVREHGLQPGDVVIWDPDASFKIVKRARLEELLASQAEELEVAS